MDVRSQIAMVFHLDKCIGCHTCSIACKNVWTDRRGTEYMWWNNVETKPGTGFPTVVGTTRRSTRAGGSATRTERSSCARSVRCGGRRPSSTTPTCRPSTTTTSRSPTSTRTHGQIPHIIVEMNPETVKKERAAGEPIIFGDATNEAVLREAAITEARIAVVAINDPVSVRRITDICRRMNPKLYLIIRTRYLNEVKPLQELGADEVIPEEFETSVEIFTRVLSKYLVPRDRIDEFISEIRSGAYQVLRNPAAISSSLPDLIYRVSDVSILSYTVHPASPVAGKTLGEINLRKVYGILVLAVVRYNETITNPGGETRLEAHNIVVIQGTAEQVARAASLFGAPAAGGEGRPPEDQEPSPAEKE